MTCGFKSYILHGPVINHGHKHHPAVYCTDIREIRFSAAAVDVTLQCGIVMRLEAPYKHVPRSHKTVILNQRTHSIPVGVMMEPLQPYQLWTIV